MPDTQTLPGSRHEIARFLRDNAPATFADIQVRVQSACRDYQLRVPTHEEIEMLLKGLMDDGLVTGYSVRGLLHFRSTERGRDIHVNYTWQDNLAVGVYSRDGDLISGTRFQAWPAILKLIARAEREGHDARVFVRSDLAVNTPDGLVF